VPVLSDRMDEPDETIILNFSNPVNVLLVDTQAVATITDDDPVPGLSVDDVTVAEGDSGTKNLTFTVRLSAASGRTVTVQYATADDTASAGSDYTSKSGTLSFSAGWLVQTITVPFHGDVAVEFDERFLINLAAPLNAVIDDGQAEGRLLNDDEEGGTSASNLDGDGLVVKLPGTKAGPQAAKERTASATSSLADLSLDTALLAIIAEFNGSFTDGKRRK